MNHSASASYDASTDESYHGGDEASAREEHLFHFISQPSSIALVNHFVLQWGKHPVSYQSALERMANGELADALSHAIIQEARAKKWNAIFWECAPVQKETMGLQPFEFVVLPAPSLAKATLDVAPFREKLTSVDNEDKAFAVFQNLGGDAILVVPQLPTVHLLDFLAKTDGQPVQPSPSQQQSQSQPLSESGKNNQRQGLWKAVGEAMLQRLSTSSGPVWLSTSGLGVSWLHVRLDSAPKYYNYDEFKVARPVLRATS
eukprot:scaffold978_cov172-Ochromonas_danica.AAC.3